MYSVESSCAYDLREKVLSVVIHDGHMVRVPTDRTADMEHKLRDELKNCRYLVTRDFHRMIVTGVDGQNLVVLCCVCSVEIM